MSVVTYKHRDNVEDYKNNTYEIAKVILYFANKMNSNLYKTKLNKLLFYSQFLFYKEKKYPLFENNFIVDFHGPVMENMNTVLHELEEMKIIKLTKTQFGTVISPLLKLNDTQYGEELPILKKVYEKFRDYTSAMISDYSHRESVWSEKRIKEIIPIERAIEIHDF